MDIKCVVCGEPWDAYGVNHGDMEAWEADLFKKGAGCPACCGKGEWEPKGIFDFENGDEDEMERIIAYENRDKRPEWKKPELVQPERGCVYESAEVSEICYVDTSYDVEGRYVPYRAIRERGRFEKVREGDFQECIVPELLTYSDSPASSSSLVQASNYQVFVDEFGDDPDVRIFSDGYSEHGVLILTTSKNEKIARTLASLHDYPLLDESVLSELEAKSIERAWDEWASGDFQKLLLAKIEDEERDVFDLDFNDAELRDVFEAARDVTGAEWENRCGDEMEVNLERVASAVRCEKTDDGYVFEIGEGESLVQAWGTWSN